MTKKLTQTQWRTLLSRAPDATARKLLVQDMTSGAYEIEQSPEPAQYNSFELELAARPPVDINTLPADMPVLTRDEWVKRVASASAADRAILIKQHAAGGIHIVD